MKATGLGLHADTSGVETSQLLQASKTVCRLQQQRTELIRKQKTDQLCARSSRSAWSQFCISIPCGHPFCAQMSYALLAIISWVTISSLPLRDRDWVFALDVPFPEDAFFAEALGAAVLGATVFALLFFFGAADFAVVFEALAFRVFLAADADFFFVVVDMTLLRLAIQIMI
jgi:hypothetical protein